MQYNIYGYYKFCNIISQQDRNNMIDCKVEEMSNYQLPKNIIYI